MKAKEGTPNPNLILKKNFEIHPDSPIRYPGDFAGHHMAVPCRWKGDRHGNFLPDREVPGGFNKRAAGTDITYRCDKCTISGFAGRCRQNFIKALPAALSSIHTIQMPIYGIRFGHTETCGIDKHQADPFKPLCNIT